MIRNKQSAETVSFGQTKLCSNSKQTSKNEWLVHWGFTLSFEEQADDIAASDWGIISYYSIGKENEVTRPSFFKLLIKWHVTYIQISLVEER